MRSNELDYDLPPELIAQHPVEPRDASRLLVFDRATGAIRHRTFADLPEELDGHLVVVNDTRVVPARLRLRRGTGGAVELLLLERLEGGVQAVAVQCDRVHAPGHLAQVEQHPPGLLAGAPESHGRPGPLGEHDGHRRAPPPGPENRETRHNWTPEPGESSVVQVDQIAVAADLDHLTAGGYE